MTPAAQDESRTSGDTLTNEPRGSGDPDARARGAIVGDVDGSARTEEEEGPRRFMGCFPRIRSRRVKSQLGRCLGSTLLLLVVVAICGCPLTTPPSPLPKLFPGVPN